MKNTEYQSAAKIAEKEIPIYAMGFLGDPEPCGKDNISRLLVNELGLIKRYNQDTGELDRFCLNYQGRTIMYVHVDPEEEYGYLLEYNACIQNNEELALVFKTLLVLHQYGAYISVMWLRSKKQMTEKYIEQKLRDRIKALRRQSI